MEYKVYSAQGPEDLRTRSKEHGDIQVVLQLDKRELISSASKWTPRHLVTYRLLTRPEAAFLPTFETNHNEQCPVCKNEHSLQELDHTKTPRDLCTKTEGELMRLPGGFFWAALARAARPELADQAKVYPQRERKQVQREGYIDSASAIPGSSSPIQHSSSEFEADMDDLDEDVHEERRSKPEEVTVHLVTSFLQYALSLCLLQHTTGMSRTEVRPRVERKRTTVYVSTNVPGFAQAEFGWKMDHPYLALLEAKRAFKYIHFEERIGSYIPSVSNEHLAQYLGEAVITWKGNQERLGNDVFLIAATNTFVRFIHFAFGRDYMEYLDTMDEKTQIDLANNDDKDAFVYMHSTGWFNLQTQEGRRIALCHILALLRWHDAEDIRRQTVGYEPGDDSDYGDDSMDIGE
ncbi:hypothetical protein QBC46DRAFT_368712 [Diplogelasinospora grovesii]|uniref:Uncharacterized protein n=1 Tax=Diplogelasinospora grovesii TaxID=303347 RepID=A0AAN6MU67_9PEZI|nr:hypothetical protein QBC46DRAFT_368712 [Diplogelasinospora grovesii]